MNILVPVNGSAHIQDYIQAGADEFYTGFTDAAWYERFCDYEDINRMSGFKERANQCTFEEMLEVVNTIAEAGKAGYITFNASSYSQEQLDFIGEHYFKPLARSGAAGVITANLEMAALALAFGLDAVASTMCAVYNSDIARIYASAGLKRIIVPRDVSTAEIAEISADNPELEIEVFLMRNGCVLSDAHCLGHHRQPCGALCGNLRSAYKRIRSYDHSFDYRHEIELNDMVYNKNFHRSTCGLCAIYRLLQSGATAGKLVGRSDNWKDMAEDIAIVCENRQIARQSTSEQAYLERMRMPKDRITLCKLGLSCYYPEVRFGE